MNYLLVCILGMPLSCQVTTDLRVEATNMVYAGRVVPVRAFRAFPGAPTKVELTHAEQIATDGFEG